MTTKENVQFSPTQPYSRYVDPEIFNEERKKIFEKNWIFVGHTSQVEKVGDFLTLDVAGEPIIITHGTDGELRAFYNICPHRGMKVEQSDQGNKKVLQCGYHGWTFKLDGNVNRAPNFKTNELGEHSCMKSIRLEVQHSMIFVNLDNNAASLSEAYQEFLEEMQEYSFFDSVKLVRETQRVVKANWKSVVDNYLECDHCSIAHPGFAKSFDLSNFCTTTHDKFTYQYMTASKEAESDRARFYWIWPNMMINVYPGDGNVNTIQVVPVDANTSLGIYRDYSVDETITKEKEEYFKFVDQVRREDFELVEKLQKGLDSKAFVNGIFSPTEHAAVYFHELIKKAL
ncbi:aromatic ring-hydroxylating oxygenase subunit alpha [Pseudalkalibacillus decolorationis]|uniref:aromatic ring-hydroxylating oxygenase subunit alpha n=1 Tax=Pseudalkalibacillus decolorationis TaxID=163879 RepID=UPI002147BAE8|nr:aromatic ring-hydroxylating dioxygenase subunit alpha [Pseudalkalibacillus decolorationis]